MTTKQIENELSKLSKWENGKYVKLSPEDEKVYNELKCREMINSHLAYDECFYNETTKEFSDYADRYIIELGEERCIELNREQIETFSKATINRNTYVDNEGCSYNEIIW